MFFGWSPFAGISFIFPIIFLILGIRIVRHILREITRSRRSSIDTYTPTKLPYDDQSAQTRYAEPELADSRETELFRLADELKGQLTVSDIVIGTNLGLKEAERAIDALVDGVHVTMEVTDTGRVIYEFPEIIAKYERGEEK